MSTLFFQTLQEQHLTIWREKDSAKRLDLMTGIYSEDISMFDPEFTLKGYQAISDFVGKLHLSGDYFDFKASKPIEVINHGARLFWTIQMKATDAPITGMDFFIVKNERVTELFAFVDKPA